MGLLYKEPKSDAQLYMEKRKKDTTAAANCNHRTFVSEKPACVHKDKSRSTAELTHNSHTSKKGPNQTKLYGAPTQNRNKKRTVTVIGVLIFVFTLCVFCPIIIAIAKMIRDFLQLLP